MDLAHDVAHKDTDKDLAKLERRVRKVYEEARKDVQKKMNDFNRRFSAKDRIYQQQLKEGKITKEQYQAWLQGQVFQGKQWKSKLDQLTETLVHADDVAQKIINGRQYGVFANNANWQSYNLEHEAGLNFGFELYDSGTVERLLRDNPKVLPRYKLDIPKDQRWNQSLITRQVTQGIIQGESLANIAKRLEKVTDHDKNLCLTRARTAMTGAQNAGRIESLTRAGKMGIKVKKEWLATLDGHTRTSHRKLDGVSIPVLEKFKGELGDLEYPGDPHGPAGEVYNCRCTLIGDLVDYPDLQPVERYDNIDGKPIKDMTYQEWQDAKALAVEKPVKTVEKPKPLRVFTPAKTMEEAVEFAGVYAETVDFGKLPLKTVNEINDTYSVLAEKYGVRVPQIATYSRGDGAAHASYRHIEFKASYFGRPKTLLTDWKASKNANVDSIEHMRETIRTRNPGRQFIDKLNKQIERLERENKFIRFGVVDSHPDQAVKTVATHEFGHFLADVYCGQINGERAWKDAGVKSYWSVAKPKQEAIEAAYARAGESGDIFNISAYGATDKKEFFAETFAMLEMGESLPNYIEEMFKVVFS